MNPLSVGIIGCGRISDLHALGYKDWPDAHIVAVCDNSLNLPGRKPYENFVFYPSFVRAKEMIDAGEIGEPQLYSSFL